MSGDWSSPIKLKKEKKEKPPPTREQLQKIILKSFGKPKCVISPSHAKKILNSAIADLPICEWVERWIDNFVRGNCYPPQLRSDDFYPLLPTYFDQQRVLEVLEQIRTDFHRAFPLIDTRPADDDLAWLPPLLRADALAVSLLPPQYLD
jgi:hypothetical protein